MALLNNQQKQHIVNDHTEIEKKKNEAKEFSREYMRGIWAAALTPFNDDLSLDEMGLRRNIRHWVDDLKIQGLFIAGKQGEFWSMSMEERMQNMRIAVEETGDRAQSSADRRRD